MGPVQEDQRAQSEKDQRAKELLDAKRAQEEKDKRARELQDAKRAQEEKDQRALRTQQEGSHGHVYKIRLDVTPPLSD